MKSLLEYTEIELNQWIEKVRKERDDIRSGRISASQTVKREKREKVERKARDKGIEVLDMKGAAKGIMDAFLKG